MKNRSPLPLAHAGHEAADRLPGLTGLRGVACLMVFGVHFGQISQVQGRWGHFDLAQLLANGHAGVALFFALSGFVLSLPHWHAMLFQAPAPAVWPYLLRRAARVLPAYFVCLTALIIIHKTWQKDDGLLRMGLHYLLLLNFSSSAIFAINPPFWTLAVEAQFYLLLPLIMRGLRRQSVHSAMALLLMLSLLTYGIHWVVMSSNMHAYDPAAGSAATPVLTYSLLAHLPHFLFGCVAGAVFSRARHHGAKPKARNGALSVAVLTVLIILASPMHALLQIPYGRYNLPFVPVLLCLIILWTPVSPIGRLLLDWAPIRVTGLISYGVYIFHLPIQNLVARTMGKFGLSAQTHWALFGVTSLVLTLFVATLSYWLVERRVVRAMQSALRARAERPPRSVR